MALMCHKIIQNVNLLQLILLILYLFTTIDNGGCKIANKQMTDYLDDNLFETDLDLINAVLR